MDFPIEYKTDLDSKEMEYNLYPRIEQEFEKLTKGHQDITYATVVIEKPAEGRQTTPLYAAKITVYMRPNNLAAVKKHETPEGALKDALRAIERQVRDQREKLKEDRGGVEDMFINSDLRGVDEDNI